MITPETSLASAASAAVPSTDDALRFFSARRELLRELGSTLTVVKVGGSIQDVPEQIRGVMREVATLGAMGARAVVVHGGGKAISAATKAAGIEPRFVAGQRYTDEATLAVAERVLAETVSAELCEALAGAGAVAEPMHSLGRSVLHARLLAASLADAPLGLVGMIDRVDTAAITEATGAGRIPVIGPIAQWTGPGAVPPHKLNVNADLAAGAIAKALGAARFVLISDTAGVRTNPADATSVVPTLDRAHIERLKASGAIDGGMLPKIEACQLALEGDANCRVTIADGRSELGLLRAVLAEDEPPRGATRITR